LFLLFFISKINKNCKNTWLKKHLKNNKSNERKNVSLCDCWCVGDQINQV